MPAKAKSDIKDIWTLIKENKAQEEKEEKKTKGGKGQSREPNIIVLGPRGSGKSTLIKSYSSKDSDGKAQKPTTALDYNFVRSNAGMKQEVTHFWELGGGRPLVKLLEIPLTPERMINSLIVVVLDLSKPESVCDDATFWLKAIQAQLTKWMRYLQQKKLSVGTKLLERAKNRFGENHPDKSKVELTAVPVLLVANKWDIFLSRCNSNPDYLRTMSRSLRAIAHQSGATLYYCSSVPAHKNLLQGFRLRIARHVGGRPDNQPNIVDHTKPIAINSMGSDSFEEIETAGPGPVLEGWVRACRAIFPPSDSNTDGELPSLDLFPEPLVDTMLVQRNEDLQRQEREKALERKLKATEHKSKD